MIFAAKWALTIRYPSTVRYSLVTLNRAVLMIMYSENGCWLLSSFFFFLVLWPLLSYLVLPAGPFFWTFSRKFFNIFCKEIGFFVWLLFSELGGVSWLVVCAACCHMTLVFAVMHLYNIYIFYCFCPFLFYTFLKSGIDKSTEWSMILGCPSRMCFFNRGDTKGTNSSKKFCVRCLCMFCFM